MTTTTPAPISGYLLTRVFTNKQTFEGHAEKSAFPDLGQEPFAFGWEWWIEEGASDEFSVAFSVQVDPTRRRPETIYANLIGTFRMVGAELTVPVVTFAQFHAPSILMPYVREAVSNLSSRGLTGPLHLPPINIAAMMQDADMTKTIAYRQAMQNPKLAKRFTIAATRQPILAPARRK